MNEKNELDPLEARLHSWTPRRPSAVLERRLFRPAAVKPRSVMLAGWLAPAAACLIFAGAVLNPRSTSTLPGSQQPRGMIALILSNQSYAAYLPGSFKRTHNQLETFSKTSIGAFASATNLMQ
jgi:hypothetical protein